MSSSFFIIILVALAVAGLLILGVTLSARAGRRGKILAKNLDIKYIEFIETTITNTIVDRQDLETELNSITEKAKILLKPEVDSLIAHINATDLSDVHLNYESECFNNVVSLAESFYEKRHKKKHPLSQEDEKKLYKALEDGIRADLVRRSTKLLSGNL